MLLIKNQYKTLPLLLACGFVMAFSMETFAAMFYVAVISTMISLGTIAYDEFDHGYTYLLSLPVDNRTYVREKYLFGAVWGAGCIILGLVMDIAAALIKGNSAALGIGEIAPALGGTAVIILIILSFMIPARIKFGSEKSSIVLFVIAGLIAALFAAFRYGKIIPVSWVEKLSTLSEIRHPGGLIAAGIAAALLLLLLSERLSERIMIRKEF